MRRRRRGGHGLDGLATTELTTRHSANAALRNPHQLSRRRQPMGGPTGVRLGAEVRHPPRIDPPLVAVCPGGQARTGDRSIPGFDPRPRQFSPGPAPLSSLSDSCLGSCPTLRAIPPHAQPPSQSVRSSARPRRAGSFRSCRARLQARLVARSRLAASGDRARAVRCERPARGRVTCSTISPPPSDHHNRSSPRSRAQIA